MEFGAFPDKARMEHFDAEEYFVIDDTLALRNLVAKHLQKYARTSVGDRFNPKRHFLQSYEAPVRYLKRRNARMALPLNVLDFFVYQKDPLYAIEQEYRFAWIFFDREKNIPVDVAPEPIDIPISTTQGITHIKFE